MRADSFYYDLARKHIEKEQNFITSLLIKSKIKLGLDRNSAISEEVIVYIAHLLAMFSCSHFLQAIHHYVRNTDIEVFQMADNNQDKSSKYHIYKSNADYLLVQLGIFQNPKDTKNSRAYHLPKNHYISRAVLYYEMAQDYLHQIYRKKNALFDVFENLTINFDEYLQLLTQTRREYFCFLKKDKACEFTKFLQDMTYMEENVIWQRKQDEFLDLYSQWLKTKSNKTKKELCTLAMELQIINREFEFKLPA